MLQERLDAALDTGGRAERKLAQVLADWRASVARTSAMQVHSVRAATLSSNVWRHSTLVAKGFQMVTSVAIASLRRCGCARPCRSW